MLAKLQAKGCRKSFEQSDLILNDMQRIPEPELMNGPEQALAYANADFSEPHDHFIDLFRQHFPGLAVSGTVLDLGCGPADISRRFARAFPSCVIHGIDGASNMLRLGQEANEQEHLSERIELHERQLPCDELPLSGYDIIISNSLLHHLHEPMVLWQSLKQFANPGAAIFIMDLKRPASSEIALKLVKNYARDEPEILRQDFLASLHAAFSIEEIRQQLARLQLSHLQVTDVSDRHLIVYGYQP